MAVIDPEKILTIPVDKIKFHLRQYLQLYTNPIAVYRRIISNRDKSTDLLIHHLFYYVLITCILLPTGVLEILAFTLLDILHTLIPFSIYYIPFAIFTQLGKVEIKPNRLFRFLLVIKLQLIPIVIIVMQIAKFSKAEVPYLMIPYLLVVMSIFHITILPITLTTIKARIKIYWVLANYLAINVFVLVFVLFAQSYIKGKHQQNDFLKFLYSLQPTTPATEFDLATLDFNYTPYDVQHDDYMTLVKTFPNSNKVMVNHYFITSDIKRLINAAIDKKKSTKEIVEEVDSASLEFNRIWNDDFITLDSTDSLKFDLNKKYFTSWRVFMSAYAAAHFNWDSVQTYGYSNKGSTYKVDDDHHLLYFSKVSPKQQRLYDAASEIVFDISERNNIASYPFSVFAPAGLLIEYLYPD